jgi:iron-sulfur cluster assembly protein
MIYIYVRGFTVLTLTAPAIDAIRTLTSKPGLGEKSGLRIIHQDTAGSLELSISPEPDAGDEIIEADGARVFLQTEVATMLSDRTLGARVAGDDVVFRID